MTHSYSHLDNEDPLGLGSGATGESTAWREFPHHDLFHFLAETRVTTHKWCVCWAFLTVRKSAEVNQTLKYSPFMIYILDWAEVSGPSQQTSWGCWGVPLGSELAFMKFITQESFASCQLSLLQQLPSVQDARLSYCRVFSLVITTIKLQNTLCSCIAKL